MELEINIISRSGISGRGRGFDSHSDTAALDPREHLKTVNCRAVRDLLIPHPTEAGLVILLKGQRKKTIIEL